MWTLNRCKIYFKILSLVFWVSSAILRPPSCALMPTVAQRFLFSLLEVQWNSCFLPTLSPPPLPPLRRSIMWQSRRRNILQVPSKHTSVYRCVPIMGEAMQRIVPFARRAPPLDSPCDRLPPPPPPSPSQGDKADPGRHYHLSAKAQRLYELFTLQQAGVGWVVVVGL